MSECKYRASDGECLYQKQFPYIEYCVDGPCPNYTVMTNGARIRAMTDEELVEWIIKVINAEVFRVEVLGTHPHGVDDWLNWLKEEAQMADRLPYCFKCNERVTYSTYEYETPTRVDVRGIVFYYNEVHAKCNKCGLPIYVPWVNDMNVSRRKEAYLAAKAKLKGENT